MRSLPFPLLTAALPALTVALLMGCQAENAVLDVRMGLPSNPIEQPMFVRVLVSRSDFPLPAYRWVPTEHELANGLSTYEFSIEDEELACDPEIDGDCDLRMEVMFCVDRECTSLCTGCPTGRSDPQAVLRYQLEQPLFVGQRTQWNPVITEIPTCADDPATCLTVNEPGDSNCQVTPNEFITAPTWLCQVDNCREIICESEPGGGAGQCTGGLTGPHLCDQ